MYEIIQQRVISFWSVENRLAVFRFFLLGGDRLLGAN